VNDPRRLFGRFQPARPAVALVVIVLCAANIVLAAATAHVAMRPKPIVAVPGAPSPRTIEPDRVDPAMLDAFARLYVAHVDNYTPETVEEATERVARWIAPQAATAFAGEARRRIERSKRERIAHQVVLEESRAQVVDRGEGIYEVAVDARLARYFGDRLGQTVRARYLVYIRTGTATESNPYGLWILGHRLLEEQSGEGGSR
jgi:hypothetical protein